MASRKGNGKPEKKPLLEEADWALATGTGASDLQVHLVNEVARTLHLPSDLSEEEQRRRIRAAIAMLKGIEPKDEIEGMLAAQMVATHSAAMECLRRAMVDGQTIMARDMNMKNASKLLALYARQMEALDKRRGKGQQRVTVEYVNVESGGQAIVGNVSANGRKRHRTNGGPALEHTPETPLDSPTLAAAGATKRRR